MVRPAYLRNLFLLVLAIAIGVPCYLLWVVHPSYRSLLVEQTEASAVRNVRYLSPIIGLEHKLISRADLPDNLEVQLQPAFGDERLMKLRFFSASGEIIFSTVSSEEGTVNNKNYFREVVAQGKVFSKVVKKDHKTADGVLTKLDVVETYVPFMLGRDFGGAIEVYYDITDANTHIEALTLDSVITIISLSVIFLAVLGLSLIGRARSLRALESSRRDLATVAENIPVAVFRCDIQGQITWFNSLAEFFLDNPSLGSQPDWLHVCHEEDFARISAAWQRAIGKRKRYKEDFRMLVSGSELWVQCEVIPEYDMAEKVVGLIATLTNITDMKMIEVGIKEAQMALMQQEKMASVGQLAAGIAHEINNPMGFVTSNLGTLARYTKGIVEYIQAQNEFVSNQGASLDSGKLADLRKDLQIDFILEDLDELVKESLDGANRIKVIVQTLKDYARIDQGARQPEDLNACIDTTLKLIAETCPAGVAIEKDYAALPQVGCYTQFLQQALMNILKNALQAVGSEGLIKIRTWTGEKSVFVEISDNGCGIPAENLPLIFDPFFTTRPVGEGTGLGLSFAQDTINNHDGDIKVASEAGEGTTFRIRLPLDTSAV